MPLSKRRNQQELYLTIIKNDSQYFSGIMQEKEGRGGSFQPKW